MNIVEFTAICSGKSRLEACNYMRTEYGIGSTAFNTLYKKAGLLKKRPTREDLSKLIRESKTTRDAILRYGLRYGFSSSAFYAAKKRFGL